MKIRVAQPKDNMNDAHRRIAEQVNFHFSETGFSTVKPGDGVQDTLYWLVEAGVVDPDWEDGVDIIEEELEE